LLLASSESIAMLIMSCFSFMKKFLLPLLAIGFLVSGVHAQSLDQQYNDEVNSKRNAYNKCMSILRKAQWKDGNVYWWVKPDNTITQIIRYYEGECGYTENVYVLNVQKEFGSGCVSVVKREVATSKNPSGLVKYNKCGGYAVTRTPLQWTRAK